MGIDQTDAKIIALLQDSADLTNEEIGERVHLSPTAIAKRRKRLTQAGIILGEVAVVSLKKIGPFVSALVLCSLRSDGSSTVDMFVAAINEVSDVTNCWVTAGDADIALQIMTRTMDEYEQVLRDLQERFPQMTSTRSYFVLRHTKRSLAVPFAVADQKDRRQIES